MNEWVRRSIAIADARDYLFKLSAIYPAELNPRAPLSQESKRRVQELHAQGDKEGLLKALFDLTDRDYPFPIEHPYASILRQRRELLPKNPKMVDKLGSIILTLTAPDIIRGIERPIDINRSMGPKFQRWVKDHFPQTGVPVLDERSFDKNKGRAFLAGSDTKITKYIEKKLGVNLGRGRDFLYYSGKEYAVGEARFLSTAGGSQNRDIRETISFIRGAKSKINAVGVLDGIIWYDEKYKDMLSALGKDEPVMSVLLLEDFLAGL